MGVNHQNSIEEHNKQIVKYIKMKFLKFIRVLCIIVAAATPLLLVPSILLIYFPNSEITALILTFNPNNELAFLCDETTFFILCGVFALCLLLAIILPIIIKNMQRRYDDEIEEYDRREQERRIRLKEDYSKRNAEATQYKKQYYDHYDRIAKKIADRHGFEYRIKWETTDDEFNSCKIVVLIRFYFYDCNHRRNITADYIKGEINTELDIYNPIDFTYHVYLVRGYKKNHTY